MHTRFSRSAVVGVAFIAVGLLLFGAQVDLWPAPDVVRLWPVALVAIGVRRGARTRDGFVWIGYGAVLLLSTFGVMALRVSWPLLIVVHGASMLLAPGSACGHRKDVSRVD